MAVFEPGSGETRENLIARADAVMYEIKRSGKGWYRLAAAPGATVSDRCEA